MCINCVGEFHFYFLNLLAGISKERDKQHLQLSHLFRHEYLYISEYFNFATILHHVRNFSFFNMHSIFNLALIRLLNCMEFKFIASFEIINLIYLIIL